MDDNADTRSEKAKEIILAKLQNHCRGYENRIKKRNLLFHVNHQLGFAAGNGANYLPLGDREMRLLIEELRFIEEGALLCSTLRGGGGYYWATSFNELEESLSSDWNRVKNTAARLRSQAEHAKAYFGKEVQLQLI